MWLIVLFGLGMIGLSLSMIINKDKFAQGIVTFSNKAWFHPFEVISRILIGTVFIYAAGNSQFNWLFLFIGYCLLLVGLGLLLIGETKHKAFAIWAADRFVSIFPIAGLFSLGFGTFLIYAALQ